MNWNGYCRQGGCDTHFFTPMWKLSRIHLLLAVTTGLMQLSTQYMFNLLRVGYSLALFQTSTLLSVLFGYRFFQERHICPQAVRGGHHDRIWHAGLIFHSAALRG